MSAADITGLAASALLLCGMWWHVWETCRRDVWGREKPGKRPRE